MRSTANLARLLSGISSIGLLAVPPGQADDLLTLEAAVRLALANSGHIRVAELESEAARAQARAAGSRFLPQVSVEGAASYSLMENTFELREPINADLEVELPGNIGQIDVPVTLSAPVYSLPAEPRGVIEANMVQPLSQLYVYKLERDLAELEADLMDERLRSARDRIRTAVERSYANVVRIQDGLDAAAASITAYESVVGLLTQQYRNGLILEAEVVSAEAHLGEARHRQTRLEDMRSTARENLNRLIGRPINQPLQVDSRATMPSPVSITLAQAQAEATKRRPEIAEGRLLVEQARKGVRIKKAEFLPELSLLGGYTRAENIPFVPINSARVELFLRWEVFDWGRRRHEAGAAEARAKRVEHELRDAATEVELEVAQSYRGLKAAESLVTVRANTLRAAREHLRITLERYQRGQVLTSELLRVAAELQRADAGREEALLRYWQAELRFDLAVGVRS